MKLTKCENGHFYDADKYPGCPYCNTDLQKGGIAVQGGQPEAEVAAGVPDGPVTGWLVALDGPARGRDLRLGMGRSFLGLDAGGAPTTLSANAPLAERQAVVVYDPKANAFTLLAGSSQELVYRNGQALLAEQPLCSGDTLMLGGTALRFVAFCGDAFTWEKAAAKDAPQGADQ